MRGGHVRSSVEDQELGFSGTRSAVARNVVFEYAVPAPARIERVMEPFGIAPDPPSAITQRRRDVDAGETPEGARYQNGWRECVTTSRLCDVDVERPGDGAVGREDSRPALSRCRQQSDV
jgi:hypothetical protein